MDAPSVPGPGGHGRRHRAPPTASPAAAAEPPISPDMPSVPSSQHTAATTRGGAGVQAAALGFAAQVPADVSAEAATLAPPVEARWHGPRHTRLLSSHAALLWRKAAAALPYPSPVVPFPDWLNDNSDGRPASLQVEQGLGQPNSAPTAVELGSRARQAAPPPAAGGQTAAAASEHAGRGFEAAGMREGEPDDEQLEAAFQEGLAGRGRAGSASARPAGGPAGASGAPLPPSEAAAVALLGEVVVRDHTDGLAATLAGRLGSVQRLAQQEVRVRVEGWNLSAHSGYRGREGEDRFSLRKAACTGRCRCRHCIHPDCAKFIHRRPVTPAMCAHRSRLLRRAPLLCRTQRMPSRRVWPLTMKLPTWRAACPAWPRTLTWKSEARGLEAATRGGGSLASCIFSRALLLQRVNETLGCPNEMAQKAAFCNWAKGRHRTNGRCKCGRPGTKAAHASTRGRTGGGEAKRHASDV